MMYGLGETPADRIGISSGSRVQRKRAVHGVSSAGRCSRRTPSSAHLPKTTRDLSQDAGDRPHRARGGSQHPGVMGHDGMKVGQGRCGSGERLRLADDGENVVSAAGTTNRTTLSEMQRLIADAGYNAQATEQD